MDDLNPIWVRLLGQSQLSNPSDLLCSLKGATNLDIDSWSLGTLYLLIKQCVCVTVIGCVWLDWTINPGYTCITYNHKAPCHHLNPWWTRYTMPPPGQNELKDYACIECASNATHWMEDRSYFLWFLQFSKLCFYSTNCFCFLFQVRYSPASIVGDQ